MAGKEYSLARLLFPIQNQELVCSPCSPALFTGLVAVVMASQEYCDGDGILPAAQVVFKQPLIACLLNTLQCSEHTAQQNWNRLTESFQHCLSVQRRETDSKLGKREEKGERGKEEKREGRERKTSAQSGGHWHLCNPPPDAQVGAGVASPPPGPRSALRCCMRGPSTRCSHGLA